MLRWCRELLLIKCTPTGGPDTATADRPTAATPSTTVVLLTLSSRFRPVWLPRMLRPCFAPASQSFLRSKSSVPGLEQGLPSLAWEGLGHFAVLFAKALGVDKVVGLSRKESKRQERLALGCDAYVATDETLEWSARYARQFDLIISTVASAKLSVRAGGQGVRVQQVPL